MSDQWSYCPHCGVTLAPAAKFCHACGTAVNHEEQTPPEPLLKKPEEELAETPETPTKEPETPIENLQSEAKNEEPVVQNIKLHWVAFVLASVFAVGLGDSVIPLGLWGVVGFLGTVYVVSACIAGVLTLILELVRSSPAPRFGKLFAWSSVAVMVVLMIGALNM